MLLLYICRMSLECLSVQKWVSQWRSLLRDVQLRCCEQNILYKWILFIDSRLESASIELGTWMILVKLSSISRNRTKAIGQGKCLITLVGLLLQIICDEVAWFRSTWLRYKSISNRHVVDFMFPCSRRSGEWKLDACNEKRMWIKCKEYKITYRDYLSRVIYNTCHRVTSQW